MSEQLINMIIALREAQKLHEEKPTRATLLEKQKCELRMDNWIANYLAERVQLDLWTQGKPKKTDELLAVYTAKHGDKEESEG
jgi:hypothetical protein